LRNLSLFPIDINKADKMMLARVPGIGLKSVNKIVAARRFRKLGWDHLRKIGIATNRAKYFLICESKQYEKRDLQSHQIKAMILQESKSKYQKFYNDQLSLFT